MSTTSLTDRYIWAVTRQLPEDTGPDVARELRGTLADAMEGKVAAGLGAEEAEREAVAELGDPDVLAREYGGRPHHLIGPSTYPEYIRLLKVLFPVILPLVAAATVVGQLASGDRSLPALLGEVAVVVLHATVHIGFWTTLVFALVERGRSEAERERPVADWDPDQLLTDDVPWRRAGVGELLAEVAVLVLVLGIVVWQFAGVGSVGVQILDPHLDLVWKSTIVGLLIIDLVLAVLAWSAGRWTASLAATNVLANVASAVVLVWLLMAGRLLTDVPQELAEAFGEEMDWAMPTGALAVAVILVCAWDAGSSVLKARRGARAGAE